MIRTLLLEQPFWGTALGLGLFLVLFVAVLIWIFRPGSRPEYARGADLPLHDGSAAPGPRTP